MLVRISKIGLDGHDLCCLRAVCKATRDAIDWDYLKRMYQLTEAGKSTLLELPRSEWSGRCESCKKSTACLDIPQTRRLCPRCQRKYFLTQKTARKVYRLTSDDLKHLPRYRIQSWKTAIRTEDASGVAILKHGGPRRMRLLSCARAREGKMFERRMKSLRRLNLDDQTEQKLLHIGIKQYLHNGWGGVSKIRQMYYSLIRFSELYKRLPQSAQQAVDTDPQLADNFIKWDHSESWLVSHLMKTQ